VQADPSRNSVVRVRSVLADVLRHAERRGFVGRSAAALAVLPVCDAPVERRSLTAAEARRLLEAARGDRLEALVFCGLTLGLRPVELTGLLWSGVKLDDATLCVSGSMKRRADGRLELGDVKRSTAGQRTIAMPPSLVAAMRAHWCRQAGERLTAGAAWSNQDLVFCTEIGTPLDPSNVRRTFRRVASRAGLDASFPYLLRHAAASLLIDAGKSVEEVADLFGDNPRTLYRHYRHRVRPVADAAAGPMEQLFGG
jgi:integrase